MIIIDKPYPKSCYDCWIRLNMGCKKAYYEGYPDDKKSKDCPISASSQSAHGVVKNYEQL